jgi:tungstate transport system substrate-binding protein
MKRRSLLAGLLCASLASPLALAQQAIRMSTTTSTENSGLLKYLIPAFEAKTGTKVNIIAVGTGKALELGKNGDVDVCLVHARKLEDQFVAQGWGIDRHDVMYNDFIIVGPASDPAHVKGMADVLGAFRKIASANVKFISRADNSGTDVMEKTYWTDVGARPQGANYVSSGLGMGEVLNMAAEMNAYTLTDRATYGAYKAKTGLAILVQGDKRMFNPYGIIAVNPARHQGVNYKGATLLIDWITSPDGQAKIASFKPDGEQLFFPDARQAAALSDPPHLK